jgi:hypothetical protein
MSVRLGISPIGWSNDDSPELGGDIPLDTCLAEAHELGFEGIELGHKFPRDPRIIAAPPRISRTPSDLWLVQRAPTRAIDCRGTRGDRAAPRPARRDGMRGSGLCRNQRRHRRRSKPALSSRPSLSDGGWRHFGIRLTELADRLAADGHRRRECRSDRRRAFHARQTSRQQRWRRRAKCPQLERHTLALARNQGGQPMSNRLHLRELRVLSGWVSRAPSKRPRNTRRTFYRFASGWLRAVRRPPR